MGYVLNNRILIGDRDTPALTLGNSTLVEDSLAGVSGADGGAAGSIGSGGNSSNKFKVFPLLRPDVE